MSNSYSELLREARKKLKDLEKKVCRRCKNLKQIYNSGFCQECWSTVSEERAERQRASRIVDPNTKYVRVYNPEGRLVLEHRYVMEQYLERKLEPHEVVLHRDGNRENNEIDNLMLSFKGGTPIHRLECTACGEVGKVNYRSQHDLAS